MKDRRFGRKRSHGQSQNNTLLFRTPHQKTTPDPYHLSTHRSRQRGQSLWILLLRHPNPNNNLPLRLNRPQRARESSMILVVPFLTVLQTNSIQNHCSMRGG